MNPEIKEMFDDYSEIRTNRLWDELFTLPGFIIFYRSVGLHNGLINEKYDSIKIFYDSLKETGNLKEARIESGLNQKQAKYYIDFLNKEFKKRMNKTFFEREIRLRRKVKEIKLIPDADFMNFLDNINIEDHIAK